MFEQDEHVVNISADVFDSDFDDVGFDPIEIDDSDEEAAEHYGLK